MLGWSLQTWATVMAVSLGTVAAVNMTPARNIVFQ